MLLLFPTNFPLALLTGMKPVCLYMKSLPSHPRMTDTFQHSHMSRWFSSAPDCVEVNNSDHVKLTCTVRLHSSFSLFIKDVRHKATHEKRRYRTIRQKTNHGDGQDRRKWKHSRYREDQRFLGLKKWSECRLSVVTQSFTNTFGWFLSVMWLTWPLHCPICLPGETVGLLFAVRFGSLLIRVLHSKSVLQHLAESEQRRSSVPLYQQSRHR